jgi:hypothetical protein
MTPQLPVARAGRLADRDQLLSEANVARGRLARTLDALGRKRHDLLDVRDQLRRQGRTLALIVGGGAVVLLGSVALASLLRARRRVPKPRPHMDSLRMESRGPEEVAPIQRHALLGELGRMLALGALAWVAFGLAGRTRRGSAE